jgi:hypothetical protein
LALGAGLAIVAMGIIVGLHLTRPAEAVSR